MKLFVSLTILSLVIILSNGCTTVSSAKNFNSVAIGVGSDKSVCQTYVEIPGLFFLGIPIFTGSGANQDKMSLFSNTLKNENVVYLLTREVSRNGATKVLNLNVNYTHSNVGLLFTYATMQASGTGVRNRNDAINQAIQSYESAP